MARADKLAITKLVDEPFFIQCADNLRAPDGTQAAAITVVDEVRLERRVTADPETWEVAVPYSGNFSSVQILDDGDFADAMIAGVLAADVDTDPPPGDNYRLVALCTIAFVSEYGGATTGKVFIREARVIYGSVTAPVS